MSGLSAFACQEVAIAESVDLMGTCKVGFLDHQYSIDSSFTDWVTTQTFGVYANDIFQYRHAVDLEQCSETVVSGSTTEATTATGSTNGTNSSTQTYSEQYNGSQIGGTSSYVSGQTYGSYNNPNSVLGDDLGYGDTYSENGSGSFNSTETGYVSGSSSGSGSVNYTTVTSGRGTGTYDGSAYTQTFYRIHWQGSKITFNSNTQQTMFMMTAGIPDQLAGTAVDISSMHARAEFVSDGQIKSVRSVGNQIPTVAFQGMNNKWNIAEMWDGHYVSPVPFKAVAVFTNFLVNTTLPSLQFDEIRLYGTYHMYINYDYTNTNKTNQTITNTTQQQTYDIGQQTQNQTNQLKDTTGSDTVASGALSSTQQWVENLGFVSQTASFLSDTYSAVAGVEPSNSIHFPGIQFQSFTLVPEQDVPLTGWLPAEIENQVKTFLTVVFALIWFNGLKNLFEKIFENKQEVEVSEE